MEFEPAPASGRILIGVAVYAIILAFVLSGYGYYFDHYVHKPTCPPPNCVAGISGDLVRIFYDFPKRTYIALAAFSFLVAMPIIWLMGIFKKDFVMR